MHAAAAGRHEPFPEPGTARRANGEPADLAVPSHYPVTAACRECGREIWRRSLLLHAWQHMDAPLPPQ